jgi:hypothetical protein
MITITSAAVYSIKGEIAYEITYSEGTKVRAVESKGNIIRKEAMIDGEWKLVGKPYVVVHNKQRAAEKIKKQAQEFLAQ